jgi:hypothetical protein
MKLSLIVRGQHPPGDPRQHLNDDLDLVRTADKLGFDGIVKGSHFSAHPFQSVQQIPFLAYCAAIAPRLRIICGLVLVPLHKPLDLAEQLATLDLLSGGKLVFGAGIGYRDVEFKAFGIPRGKLGARFEECLLAIRRLWTEDFVTMSGAEWELDHATCPVKPLQKPMPTSPLNAPPASAIAGTSTRTIPSRRSSGRWTCTNARWTNTAAPSPPKSRCGGKCSSPKPAPRRSVSPNRILKRNTKPTANGARTK